MHAHVREKETDSQCNTVIYMFGLLFFVTVFQISHVYTGQINILDWMKTETCCVQLMKTPLQESAHLVRSIFQTDRQAGKQIDRQRPAVWSWWGIPAGVCTSGQKQTSVDCGCAAEAVPPAITVFIVDFFFTSFWSLFLFLSQYLLWVSSWPVCGVFFFFFHNIYFGFLLYQFVGVFCFFHSLMISSWSVCSFLSSSFTVFICNFFFTNLWGFLSFSFVFFSSLFFFFFHNLYL